MIKLLLGLLKGGNKEKSNLGSLAWEIREAIKGKELDPNELIQIQTKINEIEAKHRSVFVAGWRPFVGWTCGVALCYHFVLQPFLLFLVYSFGYQVDLPVFDMSTLTTILLGLLGLGGMRSFEKVKRSA